MSARSQTNMLAFSAAMATNRPTNGLIFGISLSPAKPPPRYRLAAAAPTRIAVARPGMSRFRRQIDTGTGFSSSSRAGASRQPIAVGTS